MKIYVHRGPGHYIGSTIVVVAGTIKEARKMIREELDECGLKNEPFGIDNFKITPGVILSNNGDY